MTDDEIYLAMLEDVGIASVRCIKAGIDPKQIQGVVSYGAYRILAQQALPGSGTATFMLPGACTIRDVVMSITAHAGIEWCLKIPEGV